MSWIIAAGDDQIAMGVKVEKEHANTIKWIVEKVGGKADDALIEEVAKKIAEDHLKEMPDYYTKLKEMEAKKGNKEHADEFHKNLKKRLGQE